MLALPNAALAVSRWHNGAGRKADLAAGPGWLAGFAWLEADAPFSNLPGMARTITLVEGPGFTLDIAGRPPLDIHTRFAPASFDGGAATYCRILAPSRVLNAMTDRGAFTHAVRVSGTPGPVDPGGAAACFLVSLTGGASVADGQAAIALGPLDAVQLDGPARWSGAPGSQVAILTIDPLQEESTTRAGRRAAAARGS